jgi:hypothetical protein
MMIEPSAILVFPARYSNLRAAGVMAQLLYLVCL